MFFSPVYNRYGLTGWIKTAQPAQTYAGYPGGMDYGASRPQYPQLPSAPILCPQFSYPQPYAQPYGIGGYFQPSLQPYAQPVYPPMINQLPVYSPMINRVPYGYLPY